LERQRLFEEPREIVAEDTLAIPAPPGRVLRIEVIKIDASAGAHDLEALTASLNNSHILGLNRKAHRHPLLTACVILLALIARHSYSTLFTLTLARVSAGSCLGDWVEFKRETFHNG
jgi:hypothetical protein